MAARAEAPKDAVGSFPATGSGSIGWKAGAAGGDPGDLVHAGAEHGHA